DAYHTEIRDLLLIDVTPLSIGIEIINGEMVALIQRNTTIPTRCQCKMFTNAYGYQTTVTIKIYAGEHRLTKYNTYLDEFILENLTQNVDAQTVKIIISIVIDANGIIVVDAEESSGIKNSVTISNGIIFNIDLFSI
ncbi:unnamed protein product, partial [Didymodactylos carnosus]